MATAAGAAQLFIIFVIFALGLLAVPNAAEYDYVLYSDPPQSLLPGQNLTYDSPIPYSSPHVLSFQHGCTVVLYNSGEATWSTNTSHGQDCYLTLLPNGELVLRHNFHYPVWSSGVRSTTGSYAFILNSDGDLGVYGPELWSNTDEATLSDSDPMANTTDYVLYSYQVSTHSDNPILSYKNFRLVLTEDCNLVLEDTNARRGVLWRTNNTHPLGETCYTYLDERGEFFLKYSSEGVVWRSGKRSAAPSAYPNVHALVLRYDGRLVVYRQQIWAVRGGIQALALALALGQ